MSTTTPTSGLEQTRRLGVETTGIEIIEESERTARPQDLFWPWFAANVSVFGLSYASFVLYFGISFWQGVLVSVIGIVVSFLLCGIIAIAGKRGLGADDDPQPRGVRRERAEGARASSRGWSRSAGRPSSRSSPCSPPRRSSPGSAGAAAPAPRSSPRSSSPRSSSSASVAGYHIIMRMQSVLTWITGIVTVLYMALTLDDIDWSAVQDIPAGSTQAVIGALVMVMTGFGLGWINIAADWSRYQKRTASGPSIVAWNTFGGALAPVVLVLFGLALAGSSTDDPRRRRGRPDRHPRHAAADLVPGAVPARRDPVAGQRRRARHLLLGPHPALARRAAQAARRRPASTGCS